MSDLTDRMRTCAAYLIERKDKRSLWAGDNAAPVADAIDLLIEASNVIEAIPPPLGEPMAIIEPPPPDLKIDRSPSAVWTTGLDTLPTSPGPPAPRPGRVCPKCDSHAAKRVFRNGTELYLACPVCAAAWPYQANLP